MLADRVDYISRVTSLASASVFASMTRPTAATTRPRTGAWCDEPVIGPLVVLSVA